MRAHLLCLAACLGIASPAVAAEVRGSFSTLLAGRQDTQNGDTVSVVPAYELVSLDASELGVPGLDESRVVLNGWGRLELGKDALVDNSADVNLLFFDVRKGPVRVRLGRQNLVLGVGRMDLIDGADARIDVGGGVSAEAFGGFAVHPELKIRTNNWEGGGRLAYNLQLFDHVGEIGLSYLQRREDGEFFRNEVGADAYTLVGPTKWVAMAVMNPDTAQLIEARGNIAYSVCKCLTLNVDVERVSPALLVPLNSIFSVFADAPHDAFGGGINWSPSPYWSVNADGAALLLDQSYLGYRATLGGATYRDPSHHSAIGAEVKVIKESENGYVRGRAYTFLQILEPLRAGLDLYVMRFNEPINGVQSSTVGQASLTYDVTPSIRLAGTAAGGVTPWAKSEVEGMLRFAYGYDVDFSREVAP